MSNKARGALIFLSVLRKQVEDVFGRLMFLGIFLSKTPQRFRRWLQPIRGIGLLTFDLAPVLDQDFLENLSRELLIRKGTFGHRLSRPMLTPPCLAMGNPRPAHKSPGR
jgi:hypothetical protein